MKWEVEFEECEVNFSLITDDEEELEKWRKIPSYCYETVIEE